MKAQTHDSQGYKAWIWTDGSGITCSLQESSSPKAALWLGSEDVNAVRMNLNHDDVRTLLVYLSRWVQTGHLFRLSGGDSRKAHIWTDDYGSLCSLREATENGPGLWLGAVHHGTKPMHLRPGEVQILVQHLERWVATGHLGTVRAKRLPNFPAHWWRPLARPVQALRGRFAPESQGGMPLWWKVCAPFVALLPVLLYCVSHALPANEVDRATLFFHSHQNQAMLLNIPASAQEKGLHLPGQCTSCIGMIPVRVKLLSYDAQPALERHPLRVEIEYLCEQASYLACNSKPFVAHVLDGEMFLAQLETTWLEQQ